MPRTAERSVAMYWLARSRAPAGRPAWDLHVNLADVFRAADLTLSDRRDAIVARLETILFRLGGQIGGELQA
jgi:hypothetical protein